MRLMLTVALVLLAAAPALAKEGVRAKLVHPVRMDTAPGKTITVSWRLVDAKGRPFGAGGIYLRVSQCRGRAPITVPATIGAGHYRARFKVPPGGLRKLMVGLEGIQITPTRTRRADRYFQFDPVLYRDCG